MSATEFVIIEWNAANLDEARRVAHLLVEQRQVACANIIPVIESIYMWQGKMESAQETKVILKTRAEKFDAIKKIILKNSAYEVPAILKIAIVGGHSAYLDWVRANS